MASRRIFVLGLGNPAPYTETLHSAGNLALAALQRRYADIFPPFAKARYGKATVQMTSGPRITLLQSTSFMNTSGAWARKVLRQARQGGDPESCGVILVYDELEQAPGVVKARQWYSSARGHRGVKSVQEHVTPTTTMRMARIGIGIGRPEHRVSSVVAEYVLSPMSDKAKNAIEGTAEDLMRCIEGIENEWATTEPPYAPVITGVDSEIIWGPEHEKLFNKEDQ